VLAVVTSVKMVISRPPLVSADLMAVAVAEAVVVSTTLALEIGSVRAAKQTTLRRVSPASSAMSHGRE